MSNILELALNYVADKTPAAADAFVSGLNPILRKFSKIAKSKGYDYDEAYQVCVELALGQVGLAIDSSSSAQALESKLYKYIGSKLLSVLVDENSLIRTPASTRIFDKHFKKVELTLASINNSWPSVSESLTYSHKLLLETPGAAKRGLFRAYRDSKDGVSVTVSPLEFDQLNNIPAAVDPHPCGEVSFPEYVTEDITPEDLVVDILAFSL